MGLCEDISHLRGDVLDESWSMARRLFPGVKSPLFRAVQGVDSVIRTLTSGIPGTSKSYWEGEEKTSHGVSFTRDFSMMERWSFGFFIFVVDKDKLEKRYRVGPVLSPGKVTGAVNLSANRRSVPIGDSDFSLGSYKGGESGAPESEERVFLNKGKLIPPSFIEGLIVADPRVKSDVLFIKDGSKLWEVPIAVTAGLPNMAFESILDAVGKAKTRMAIKDPLIAKPRKVGKSKEVVSEFSSSDYAKGYWPVAGLLGYGDVDIVRKADEIGNVAYIEYKGKSYTGFRAFRNDQKRIDLPV